MLRVFRAKTSEVTLSKFLDFSEILEKREDGKPE
jgi:hypothetical protein